MGGTTLPQTFNHRDKEGGKLIIDWNFGSNGNADDEINGGL